VRVLLPWPKEEVPKNLRRVFLELKARQEALKAYLATRTLFPYPLPETLGLGAVDPIDIRYENGQPVFDPGWWQKIPDRRRLH